MNIWEGRKPEMKRLICWWFGCDPNYEWPDWHKHGACLPCKRCGAPDTTYEDRCGYTRHARLKEWIHWRIFGWIPRKCPDCNKRFGKHEDCIPF